jgi:predicted phage tail protein
MIMVVGGPLRRLVGFKQQIEVEADTVEGGLRALCAQHPGLRKVLFDDSGRVRGVHRFALNHTVLGPGEMETPVGNFDELEVVTAIAGG